MSIENFILKEILAAREKRACTQRELINDFKTTLVSFTLNIPGEEKNSAAFTKVHEEGIYLLEEELKKENINIVHKMVNETAAGLEAFFNVDGDSMHIKKITVSIEEKDDIGRLFDLDVFTAAAEQVSRSQLGIPPRKCLICNESAKVCGRSRKHSIEELVNRIQQLISNFL